MFVQNMCTFLLLFVCVSPSGISGNRQPVTVPTSYMRMYSSLSVAEAEQQDEEKLRRSVSRMRYKTKPKIKVHSFVRLVCLPACAYLNRYSGKNCCCHPHDLLPELLLCLLPSHSHCVYTRDIICVMKRCCRTLKIHNFALPPPE